MKTSELIINLQELLATIKAECTPAEKDTAKRLMSQYSEIMSAQVARNYISLIKVVCAE